jgi:hypothetical protein
MNLPVNLSRNHGASLLVRKHGTRVPIVLVLLLLGMLVIPFAPVAKASTLVTSGIGWCTVGACSGSSIQVGLTGLAQGDVIIVAIGQVCNSCTPTAVLNGPTDSSGTTFNFQSDQFNHGGEEFISAYQGSYTSSSSSDTITVTFESALSPHLMTVTLR